MQQYFVKGALTLHQRLLLEEEPAHHIQHVLRMKEQEQIRIANDTEEVYLAHVEFASRQVYAVLDEKIETITSKRRILLAQALIKGEKWDYLLQKSCELGVSEILPFTSKRCVVRIKDEKTGKKLARWNKIALEACEQCKRPSIVSVREPMELAGVLSEEADLKLIAYEQADHSTSRLKDVLNQHSDAQSILCVIGPEGGFEEKEIQEFMKHGYHCVSLGPRILRAETAALSILNSITFTFDC